MQNKQKALVIKQFGKNPVLDDFDIPQPKGREVQIKIQASTINPSDRIMVQGGYWRTQPNFVGGLEGCGQVIKVASEQDNHLLGKRVSFNTGNGTWASYTTVDSSNVWVIDNDVPLQSAASGVINPLTVIGFIQTYKKWNNKGVTGKGIINTAASSALGRMLSKYCQKHNIPLLNIVRRKEQVETLEKQGAKFIISTDQENWLQRYKKAIQTHGFNVLFDAIAGGEITDKLISNLPSYGQAFMYGKLSSQNLLISKPLIFASGVIVTSWMIFQWLPTLTQEQRQQIQSNLSNLLKNQLSTNSIKKLSLTQVPELFKQSQSRASQGKFTIVL